MVGGLKRKRLKKLKREKYSDVFIEKRRVAKISVEAYIDRMKKMVASFLIIHEGRDMSYDLRRIKYSGLIESLQCVQNECFNQTHQTVSIKDIVKEFKD